MLLSEFRARVESAFGRDMQHATPANVREFLDIIQQEMWQAEKAERLERTNNPEAPIELSGADCGLTYEGVIRQFFVRALRSTDEQSLVLLWMLALDLAYSGIEDMQAESLNRLFREPSAGRE